jgi:hypothetical protein
MNVSSLTWGVPAVALIAGAFVFGLAWISSWNYERKYGREPK